MNIILFDDSRRDHLLPLAFTRPLGEFRVGILAIREKWEKWMNCSASCRTMPYLKKKFPESAGDDNLFIAGSILPDEGFCEALSRLNLGEGLRHQGEILALRIDSAPEIWPEQEINWLDYTTDPFRILNLWDIFSLNDKALRSDFNLLTRGRSSANVGAGNTIIGENFFAEEGAVAYSAVFNTTTGPIYLGKNSEVWEGSVIRGSFALGDHSIVKLSAKIYGATTVGPESRVGGELNNSVIFGYSNKGHDGFLGNSVLGEWCNIGADSNNSNLKNNYDLVKLWNYPKQSFVNTGLQFCGLIMGDHSKCGINTMFNTGTVVGVSSNIFGAGFPRNFIPSFSWGGAQGMTEYKLDKAAETAARVMERRHIEFDTVEQALFEEVYRLTGTFRQGG
jgi:UDP-N-acetylglucosamine diphosphorylase/glucosamine-1-phosphate N-acetyltransferase